jgi:hypothetical protein
MTSTSTSAILESVEWVKGRVAKTTARRTMFTNVEAALAWGKRHADNGRRVAYSSEILAAPCHGPIHEVGHRRMPRPTGPKTRYFVVTVRPRPEWERHAQEAKGHGVTGREASRAPTKAERRAAEVAKAKRA